MQQKTTVATIKKDTVANVSVSKGKQKRDTISAAEIQRRKGNYWDTAHALVDSFALAKERLREKQQLQKQQAKRIADSLVLVRANEKKQVKTPVKIEIVTVVPKQAPVKADTITVAKLEEKKLIQKTVEPVKKADTVAVIKQEEKKTIAKTEVPFKKTDTITIAKKEEKKIAEPVKPLTKHDSSARKIEDDVMQYKARQDSVKVVAAKEALVKKDTVPTEAKSQTTKAFERKNAPADNTTNLDTIQNIKSQFFLKRAQKAIADKKNKLAEEYLNKSIELWNNNYEAWLTLADQESLFGSPAKALKQYQECARIDSSKPELSYKIASLYLQSKKKTEALQYFTKTIQLDPKYTIAYMGRASIYTDFKKYDAAIADYDKALQINKNYHYAYKARGMVKQLNKQFSEAVDDFTRYLFFEESDPSAYFYRGLAKIGNNELLEGCLDLSKSAEMGYAAAEKAIKRSCE